MSSSTEINRRVRGRRVEVLLEVDNEEPLVVFMACGVDLVELHRPGEEADRKEALLWHSWCGERVFKPGPVQNGICNVRAKSEVGCDVRSWQLRGRAQGSKTRTCRADQASQIEEPHAGHASSCKLLRAGQIERRLTVSSPFRPVVVWHATSDKDR